MLIKYHFFALVWYIQNNYLFIYLGYDIDNIINYAGIVVQQLFK